MSLNLIMSASKTGSHPEANILGASGKHEHQDKRYHVEKGTADDKKQWEPEAKENKPEDTLKRMEERRKGGTGECGLNGGIGGLEGR